MTRAMVIGAGGWLGQRLVERLLAADRKVIGVDVRFPKSLSSHPSMETIQADIRDVSQYAHALKSCNVVFNCCGVLHPKSTKEIYAVNAKAPVDVFKACMENSVATFVHISSITAYGENVDGFRFLSENSPSRPKTHYGQSKAQGDQELRSLVREEKTRLIILCPGVFYGEQPSKNLCEFLNKIQTSRLPLFASRGFLRTYLDVEKAVDAMLSSEKGGISGQTYLIGDDEPLSTYEFYKVLADELGVSLKTLRVPLSVSRIAERIARTAGALGIHLRLLTIVGEFGRHTFSSSKKAQSDLRFVPHRSSLAGLRKMVQSYKTHSATNNSVTLG